MNRILNNAVALDGIELYNYDSTRKEVEKLYCKYRAYKIKEDIISKRIKSSLSLDNLGIFSTTISDPTGSKVEQLQRYSDFIELIEKTYQAFSSELTPDEKIIYKKTLLNNMPDNEVMELLCLSNNTSYFNRKKSCYIKVARWFDLEVYKDNNI
jgi:hypothetical protein